MISRLFYLLYLIAFSIIGSGQPITLDEEFSDWEDDRIAITEDIGDVTSGVDIQRLGITDSRDYIYFLIEFDREVQLQDANQFSLQIANNGITLFFSFGERTGTLNGNMVFHNDIGLVASPTVTSSIFEIQLSKVWGDDFFNHTASGEIEVRILDNRQDGDELPNNNTFLNYELSQSTAGAMPTFSLSQEIESDFRVCSYNVLNDRLFAPDAFDAYQRIFTAIQADIYVFQEIRDFDDEETLTRLFNVYGVLDPSFEWFARKRGPDNVIISKYPIVFSRDIGGNGLFIINREGQDILVVNVHFPCCENDFEREQEIDILLAFIRDSRNGLTNLRLEADTPIIIAGDTNFVGLSSQVRAILEGDIFNNFDNGDDFNPDWDSSPLVDAKAFATGTPTLTTWRNDRGSFFPGRLDYCFYSNSVLEEINAYSLDTRNLSLDLLQQNGLSLFDTEDASDHYPIVVDFSIRTSTSTKDFLSSKYKIGPNPVQDHLSISNLNPGDHIIVLDINGNMMTQGEQNLIDVSDWASGIYLVQILDNGELVYVDKVVVF